jgi:hypothetical protein
LFVFMMSAILTGVRWNLNVILICIYFMGSEILFSSDFQISDD